MSTEIEISNIVKGEIVKPYVEYHSNNSGGSFWLSDSDWRALEAAGWKVNWLEKSWLGTNAYEARRYGVTIDQAITEFDNVTSQTSSDIGCTCCGPPHSFVAYSADDRYIDSYVPNIDSEWDK